MKNIFKRVAAVLLSAALIVPVLPAAPVQASNLEADNPTIGTVGAFRFDYTTVNPKYWNIAYSEAGAAVPADAHAYTTAGDIKEAINREAAKYTYTNAAGNPVTGTINPSMCYLYYASNGTPLGSVGKMADSRAIEAGSYKIEVMYGSDNTNTLTFDLSVSPVAKIAWPASLPNTQYLAGIPWDESGASFVVTYTNGKSETIPVTNDMIYLSKTSDSINHSGDGTVLGAQSEKYNANWLNNPRTYRVVLKWKGYNSASPYNDYGETFKIDMDTNYPEWTYYNESLSAQGWYEFAYSEDVRLLGQGREDYTFFTKEVINRLNKRQGKQDVNIYGDYTIIGPNGNCFMDFPRYNNGMGVKDTSLTGNPTTHIGDSINYTTYIINRTGAQYYDITNYALGAVLPEIKYSAHVQNIGWQGYFYSPEEAGTDHQSLRMEALIFQIENYYKAFGDIDCEAHVQNIGWMQAKHLNETIGTTGQSKRMEAIKLSLTGQYAEKYNIEYRVHMQSYGWSEWASNGAQAGTTGQSKRLEAIEVRITVK